MGYMVTYNFMQVLHFAPSRFILLDHFKKVSISKHI